MEDPVEVELGSRSGWTWALGTEPVHMAVQYLHSPQAVCSINQPDWPAFLMSTSHVPCPV